MSAARGAVTRAPQAAGSGADPEVVDGLAADVRLRRGTFALDVRLEVAAGSTLALLGPNGSGKSTVLGLLAGLLVPDDGVVAWRGSVLTAVPGRSVPPASRQVGLLGQEPLLFPHLSVHDNVEFGPRSRGRRDAADLAAHWLHRLGIAHLAQRRPRQISGGQAARVALARALAAEPDVLLLDEPLAALDAAAAPELRQLLADTLRESEVTTVLVSHDVLDAALLADQVAVLREGAVVEQGPRAEVLSAPRTAFAAAFVGINLVPASLGLSPAGQTTGTEVTQLRFRPSAVVLAPERRWEHNSWRASIRWLEPATGGVRARLTAPAHPEAPDVLADLDPAAIGDWLHPGAQVWAHVPADAVHAV